MLPHCFKWAVMCSSSNTSRSLLSAVFLFGQYDMFKLLLRLHCLHICLKKHFNMVNVVFVWISHVTGPESPSPIFTNCLLPFCCVTFKQSMNVLFLCLICVKYKPSNELQALLTFYLTNKKEQLKTPSFFPTVCFIGFRLVTCTCNILPVIIV